jgi:hypothetical protein
MVKKVLPWILIGVFILNPLWFGVDFDVVPTTNQDTKIARMSCCHCYSRLSDGRRFYHGVLEWGSCRSQGGHCEGEAPCFPQ